MIFVRMLTPEEEKELSQWLKAASKTRIYIRLKTLELSHQGKSVQEIAPVLSRHPNSVRSYIHKVQQRRFQSLNASLVRRSIPEA